MAVSFFGKVIIPFLAYFLVEVTGEQQYGGLGGEITLTPKVSGQPQDILWKHNGNKVVEFDGSQNVEYGRYKGRTILDWGSGALTVKGLTDADSGPYELEAVVKGKLQYSQHEVDVIDNVAQPSVTCVVDNTTPENMDRTLLCSADLQPLTQFIWRIPEGSESPGPELFIPGGENQDSENQESVYTCVVKNPVSERTAEFTLKDCYTEEGSSSVLAVVLSILLLLVLVAVLAFLLWYWKKGKKPAEAALRTSEEEAGLMEVTVQVTDTEPVQDKPNPAQPKLVTPDPTQAQQGLVTPDPTQAQQDPVTPDHTPAQQDPVTPDHTPAQQDLVTPDHTPAQQDLVTPDHTPAQQDLVTPDHTPAQQDLVTPDHTQESEDKKRMWKKTGKCKEEVIKRQREEKDKRRKENRDEKVDHNRCMGANTEDEGGNEGEMKEEGIEQKEPDTEKEGDDTNQTSTQSGEEMDETPITDPNEQHITQTTLQGQPRDSTGSIENQEEMEHETSTPDPIEQHITQTTLQGQSRDSTGSIENQEEMEHETSTPDPIEQHITQTTLQGNKDPEDDHSENTGNRTSTPKGMVKEGIEFSKQDADANRKQHTAPAGRCFSPTKRGGHSLLYRQNDSLSDKQTVTDTEPVQDKPNPAQPKLVTPDPTQAQQGLVTPDPTQAQQDLVTPDPTQAQQDLVTPDHTQAQQDLVTPDHTPAQQDLVTPDHTQESEDKIRMWKKTGKCKEEVIKRQREEKDKRRKENRDEKVDHNRCMGANTEDEGGNEGEMKEEGIEQKEPDTEKEGDDTNQTSTQSDEELDETPITDPNEQHITQTTLQGQSRDSTGSIENQEEMEH
ncbi:spore wall protein 2-like isoform X2 [Salvelinus namaycush]|uniref:Spore wall protein 2-like isoform X2 n=1 Tax=Salvelinus namaycush TaxID=8040 RepID=A0A8U1BZH6_SALNM|nr:spore wall protein 2-like isoform X2 [Salvelinus namaycush]